MQAYVSILNQGQFQTKEIKMKLCDQDHISGLDIDSQIYSPKVQMLYCFEDTSEIQLYGDLEKSFESYSYLSVEIAVKEDKIE